MTPNIFLAVQPVGATCGSNPRVHPAGETPEFFLLISIIISSAYWRLVIYVYLEAGKPFIRRCFLYYGVQMSATSVNNNGDEGSPYLYPLLHLISLPAIPLYIILILVEYNHFSIQPDHLDPNFLARITSMRQSQLTLSFAFLKSNFRREPFLLSFFTLWITSYVITMPSSMF